MDERRREQLREAHRRWREKNPEKMREARRVSSRKWRATHKEENRARADAWAAEHPEKVRQYKRSWKERNPDKVKFGRKRTRPANASRLRDSQRKWRASNIEYARAWRRKWDSEHPGHIIMRRAVHRLLRSAGARNEAGSRNYVGCSAGFLRNHIEAQFRPGMTWENYGPVWHVDHIVPLAIFPFAEMPELLFVASHFSNLQPLFSEENRAKGARL